MVSLVCQIPIHRGYVIVLLLHVPQCSFCKKLPLVPDTNDLDFVSFLLRYLFLMFCFTVWLFLSTKPWVDGFLGAPWSWVMPLFLPNWDIRHPVYCQSFVFSEGIQIAGKIERGIPIHLLLTYFSMDKARIFREMISHVHEQGRRW